ncbi:sensor histidine kinase [Psychrobacillus sp. L4]|uniref:sensor histidine kinase n=1 Tax=Psychrobacillus sp. L4 TaxID=3236892 RepID=UPI0036F33880
MSWEISTSILSIIIKIIEINTGLFIGFSLVGIDLVKNVRKLTLVSLFGGLLYYVGQFVDESHLLFIFIFIVLTPIAKYYIKISFAQTVVAILLSLTFDLMVIHLVEYNFFDLLLQVSQEKMDIGIKFSLDIFIGLNNVLFSLIVYYKKPLLFSEILFQKKVPGDSPENSYRFYLHFVVFLLLVLNLGLYLMTLEMGHLRLYFRILLSIWSIIVCISLLFFLRNAINNKYERMQFFLDKQYQKDLLSFYSIIRSQRHDFNFHLTAMYGLIQNKRYDDCKVYIDGMVKDAYEINDLLPLHHPAIGAMLNAFKELAADKGIKINYYILDDLRNMPCSVYEMNKILGNLIQNAIDEYEYPKQAQNVIEVEIKSEKMNLVIVVGNSTSVMEESLNHIFQIGYSTKPAHEGLGLPTVQKIISKYNGVIYPELEEGFISFVVKIPFSS